MGSKLNPYLMFRGQAREALAFYQLVFGGQLDVMTYGDMGAADNPTLAARLMHGQVVTPAGYTLMAADVPDDVPLSEGSAMTICLSGDDEALLTSYWQGLSAGATVGQELGPQPWGDIYGDLVDQFGIRWSVDIHMAR